MAPTKADYAKINIACKELNLDKHQLISDRYGLQSSTLLNRRQLADLYAHFRRLGWKVKRKKSTSSPKYDDPQKRKIVALWITLGQAGVVRNKSDWALQAYVKRMTGVANLKWCDGEDCDRLIESLKKWGKREDADVEE
ncbi:regulatory protein GemA [Desulfopila inferna]|uniref:regulatory protein GemA n=1 Tax=Desulfopila inferna TaxID=468528 RepID=UPI001964F2C3|nr:regulatory protein GemA [Desulfopila inferna]MBM9605949.1 regulatory protein GemA [Desulfopila inferna]